MVANNPVRPARRFELGSLCATPGALHELARSGESALAFIQRHASCDWGEVGTDDAKANDEAIADEGDEQCQMRVLSVYRTKSGVRVYCITEADRSATTLLLPEEY